MATVIGVETMTFRQLCAAYQKHANAFNMPQPDLRKTPPGVALETLGLLTGRTLPLDEVYNVFDGQLETLTNMRIKNRVRASVSGAIVLVHMLHVFSRESMITRTSSYRLLIGSNATMSPNSLERFELVLTRRLML